VDRTLSRRISARRIWDTLTTQRWDLVYQEGSGIVSGLNLIRAARQWRQPFIVSSGDPIGAYFRVTQGPRLGRLFELYEKLLYRSCAGFVGWTPYLTGMALRMGARTAVTVEGGVDLDTFRPLDQAARSAARQRFGFGPEQLVCGIVGSLTWVPRQSYCYGLELIEVLKRVRRKEVAVLIVGDGEGRQRLESRVPPELRSRVIFVGSLPPAEVAPVINAIDIAFNPQTLDGLGSYRLSQKLPEYLACGVPVAMSPVPGFYDYVLDAGWALPRYHPASPEFHQECAQWLDGIDREEIARKAAASRSVAARRFDYALLSERFRAFLQRVPTAC
jgi:glycosyltransferase involved in cell wall biosynthesis